ncbi:MAG: Na+/H+ antiporter subunit C [Acidobacteria bacterium]|nr:MAG: Na+/H+ antiporter subunit C [Acidobacteriota bacterium]REK10599.1 MAG: Na+/H+ antiporter subunit C [Acidobacteriota bacterium]
MLVQRGLWVYWAIITLMMIGLYGVIARDHLVKKVMGLNVFQSSAILLYVAIGKVRGGTAAILLEGEENVLYSNPLPHVLMLTAIVVGIATTALALALTVRIQEAYGTLEEDELARLRVREDEEEAALDPHPFDPPGEPEDVEYPEVKVGGGAGGAGV